MTDGRQPWWLRALGAPPTFVEVLPLAQSYEGLKLYCEQVPA